jgi:hypothetical protein
MGPIMGIKAPPQFAVAVPFQVPMLDAKVKCSNGGLGMQQIQQCFPQHFNNVSDRPPPTNSH